MRVIYDNEIFLIQKYGGATRYFYELIRRMPALGADIVLYMGKFINEYGLEKYKNEFSVFSGKKIRYIPKTKMFSIILQKPLFEKFAEKQKFEVFHQTYYADINFKKKFRHIITVHDFTHEKLSGNFSKLDKTAERKRKAILKADGIICVSESTKNDMMNMYDVKSKKIKVIYHGNSLKHDVSEPPLIEKPYLLYVGDRRAYKNFGVLIKLFELNNELKSYYKLVCCGGGPFTKAETELISRSGLTGNFIQTEARDKNIANLYFYASAFIYPSKYEGFGIPMIEAMYNGCPVIASYISSLPEIGGNAALYFNPDSPGELNEKVKMVLNNSEVRNSLIVKGKEREKSFSWDKCAKDTFEFYGEVCG
ncbi:MAG: glycosyltransferase family 4 protein [Ignavibacteria bacterium]|nr:glycosyltransferase family 4 protein [Ignavibacteria bacterium]